MLVSALNSVYRTSGIQASQGHGMLVVVWLAAGFAVLPGIVWMAKVF